MGDFAEQLAGVSPERLRLLAMSLKKELDDRVLLENEPIAVTGMSCRFPKAPNIDAFWQVLEAGVDAITEVPPDRFDVDDYFDPDPDAPGKMYVREGGFIENVFDFDPGFFGIAPREALSMDPQQRLLLEVSWEALEDAGEATSRLQGREVGVFVGHSTNDYIRRSFGSEIDAYGGTGSATSIAAGRISYTFGLTGPNLPVDTACSSSLVALHLACQSLRRGECELALVAGVNLILAPEPTIFFCKMRALAPDGRCKTFDALANGYARGEGCGVIVLKRLSDALAAGERIYAVIRGSAVNQDGKSTGLTVPNRFAQESVLKRALEASRVSPEDVDYIEAHGTGTPLGDPIEVQAIGAVHQGRSHPLYVGTVKTNIGHLEAAAGIAGVIKTVLAIQRSSIPRNLHFHQPNPYIPWQKMSLFVPRETLRWPTDGSKPRLAGVSSFGFSGTNAHVVIEQAPAAEPQSAEFERPCHILCLGGKGEPALTELAGRMSERFVDGSAESLADLCYSINSGRSHFTHRLAVIGAERHDVRESLKEFSSGQPSRAVRSASVKSTSIPKVAFLFTGQGSQYVGMGRDLYDTLPTFREAIDECGRVLQPVLGKPLLEVLYPEEGARSSIDETAYSQPALFALQYSLARVWQSWGVQPAICLGHSVGELAAACIAGVFSLGDGLKLAAERGRLMQGLPRNGLMASIGAGEEKLAPILAELSTEVSIAAVNGPASTVVSGRDEVVRALVDDLSRRGLRSRPLTVSHAFHSSLMDPILDELEEFAAGIEYGTPRLGLVSNLNGQVASGADFVTAGYWRRHARDPVLFEKGIRCLDERGYTIYLEIGPHPVLCTLARQCVADRDQIWLPSLRRHGKDWEQMLKALAELYLKGVEVDWRGFDGGYSRRRVSLPTYPFQRSRYVLEARTAALAPETVSRTTPPVCEETSDPKRWLYDVRWEASSLGTAANTPETGTWLLFADRGGIAHSLAGKLESSGCRCILVEPGNQYGAVGDDRWRIRPGDVGDFKSLVCAVEEETSIVGIVHLWSLSVEVAESADVTALQEGVALGTGSALHLVQALALHRAQNPPPVWLVTRGVHQVGDDEGVQGLAQAPLWGLARSVAIEFPNSRYTRVDLEPRADSQAAADASAEALLSVVCCRDGEQELAIRGGDRYVPRLRRTELENDGRPEIRDSGTYLITGGLGGLGLLVAQWLIKSGARHLALVGRSGPSEAALGEVSRFREMGVEAVTIQADVADPGQVSELFVRLSETMPPLRGIVHAAGVLDDGAILQQDWSRFEKVMRPKLAGAWNIHCRSSDLPLDFLVFFSSIGSLIGAPTQANYCAANAFMDSLSHYRCARGLPATSINWGPWAEAGMAARQRPAALRTWETLGIGMLPTEESLDSLARLLASALPQVAVIKADWSRLFSLFPQGLEPPFLRELVKGKRRARPASREWLELLRRIEDATKEDAERAVRTFVEELVAEVLGRSADEGIDVEIGFFDLGMDSLMAVDLTARLQANLGQDHRLPASFLFDHPNIRSLTDYILENFYSLGSLTSTRSRTLTRPSTQPIAVIGYACRFPHAPSEDAFWDLLSRGKDAIDEVPPERWDIDSYYDPDPKAPGKMFVREGGFLDDIDLFDARFFNISPREAVKMDPQQRLLLEMTWRALENGNQRADQLIGTDTAVFVGISGNDYIRALGDSANFEDMDAYLASGNALSIAAGRVSHVFGFEGPCLAVDTACSSSLVALHLACETLRNGTSRLALAGGVNIILAPEISISLCKIGALSPDGRCKTFDASANGYVRGEGCGMVVLKRVEDARADGDRILALVRSSAVNHDGRSSGITVPNGRSQVALFREALALSGVDADEIQYVETHGTGTPLGDPIEMNSIATVYGEGRSSDRPLLVGSVKTNIGHLEAAAGVAGFIKVVQAIERGKVPPHLHFRNPSPFIDWQRAPIRIPDALEAWPDQGRRLAAISSFGFSGTNAHCIVEEAPPPSMELPVDKRERSTHLLVLSAKSEAALREHARNVAAYLDERDDAELADVFFSLNAGRAALPKRLFVVARTVEEARAELEALAGNRDPRESMVSVDAASSSRVAFLFTGQGSQYVGMGRELYETEPTFRAAIDSAAQALDGALEERLESILYGGEPDSRSIDDTLYAQPAIFALEYALARLWESWGVRPSAVAGHSVGECAAACVAGVFSFESGLRLVSERARLMQEVPRDGGMLAVAANASTVRDLLRPYSDLVSIAAINSPSNIVLSGALEPLAEVQQELERRGFRCQSLNVAHAFHSPMMRAIEEDFKRIAGEIEFRDPTVPIFSTVTGDLAPAGSISTATYWARQLLLPVRFSDTVCRLSEAGIKVFLEIGPHPTLSALGQQTLANASSGHVWLHSLRRNADDSCEMLRALGRLYLQGLPVDWRGFDGHYRRNWVALPNYPFQRQRFWPEPTARRLAQTAKTPRALSGPGGEDMLIGRRLRSPGLADIIFENCFSVDYPEFLADHRIYSMVVVPGACHLAMVVAAAPGLGEGERVELRDVAFPEGMFLADDESRLVQLIVSPEQDGVRSFRIVSTQAHEEASWLVHCTGQFLARRGDAEVTGGQALSEESTSADIEPIDSIQRRCSDHIADTKMFYRLLVQQGIELGPNFQWIEEMWRRPGEAVARLRAPKVDDRIGAYPVHPGWIDACFQVVTVTLSTVNQDFPTYLPISAKRFTCTSRPFDATWIHVTLHPKEDDDSSWFESDIRLLTESGETVLEIERFRVKHAPRESFSRFAQRRITDWLYNVHWAEAEPSVSSGEGRMDGSWLLLEDSDGTGSELARRIESLGGRAVRVRPGSRFERHEDGIYHVDPAAPGSFQELIGDVRQRALPELKGVVHMWSCARPPLQERNYASAMLDEQLYGTRSALNLVKALATARLPQSPRLFLVTRGTQPVADRSSGVDVVHSTLWGLARVVALEHPHLQCTRIDLDPSSPPSEQADLVIRELSAGGGEDQIAYRDGQRYLARLARYRVASGSADDELQIPATASYRLVRSARGSLSEISVEMASPRPTKRGEVEVRLCASALNFRDVLNALGLYPGGAGPLGWEAAGVVTAAGAGVSHLREGDEVIVLADGSFSRLVTTDARLVVPKPSNLSFASAAGIPVVFLTAYYALHELARIRPGDRILVHAAAGGVGLAAVQIAHRIGAEVFGTAGSEEKRQFLRDLGIRHVFDSRSLEFDEDLRSATDGVGVDVVLNSLSGEYIPKSLSVLADGGRFIEIGKIDTWTQEQVSEFRSDVRYSVFALDELVMKNTAEVARRLSDLMELFAAGELKPLPQTVFPIHKAKAAFRYMAQAKHIGKIILDHEGGVEDDNASVALRDDVTYLITGGLGGLGQCVARWLVESGARNLVLVGRHAPDDETAKAIASLGERGAKIYCLEADVSREEDVRDVVARIDREFAPLKGIFHAAGVLDDGILLNQEWDRFLEVMAPKVLGTIHLHNATLHSNLDFFVLFSSSAALLGFPGQGNYAAANSFLDSFAVYRQARGMPALSINWGPWDEIGMTAGLKRQWSGMGISAIKPQQGLDTLGLLLREATPQVAVLPIEWMQVAQRFPGGDAPPFLSGLIREFSGGLEPTADWLELSEHVAAAPPAERKEMVTRYLMQMASGVLGMDSPDSLEAKVPLNELGFDSLMAVELAYALGRSAGMPLTVTLLFDYPTFDALADYLLAEGLHLAPEEKVAGVELKAPPSVATPEDLAESISALTDDEVARANAEIRGGRSGRR
ncbi:MAG: SDR family NAD(P)-dependent oxidoreductase [Phycisphaerales bacterium]